MENVWEIGMFGDDGERGVNEVEGVRRDGNEIERVEIRVGMDWEGGEDGCGRVGGWRRDNEMGNMVRDVGKVVGREDMEGRDGVRRMGCMVEGDRILEIVGVWIVLLDEVVRGGVDGGVVRGGEEVEVSREGGGDLEDLMVDRGGGFGGWE